MKGIVSGKIIVGDIFSDSETNEKYFIDGKYIEVLNAISKGNYDLTSISKFINKARSNTYEILNELVGCEILERKYAGELISKTSELPKEIRNKFFKKGKIDMRPVFYFPKIRKEEVRKNEELKTVNELNKAINELKKERRIRLEREHPFKIPIFISIIYASIFILCLFLMPVIGIIGISISIVELVYNITEYKAYMSKLTTK